MDRYRNQAHQGEPRSWVSPGRDPDNVAQVRRKCAQILFNALLIADVRQNLVENGNFRPLPGRDLQAGHSHQRQKAACF